MIKSLHIQNFQSHKKTTLKFHKGINVVIGQSDSGKSAIIRALNWTINNMFDHKENFFPYQKWPFFTNKIQYMRWGQAWMLRALSTLL